MILTILLIVFILWILIDFLFPDNPDEENILRDNKRNGGEDRKQYNGFSIFRIRKVWQSRVPYAQLVREIVFFTGPILSEKGIKHFPGIKICYYQHKKNMGVFYGSRNEVRVYLKNHTNIPELVDTVLHEVAHYIQNHTNSKEFKLYDKYTGTYGYYSNPLEVDSRRFAKKWTETCIAHLAKKNVIILN